MKKKINLLTGLSLASFMLSATPCISNAKPLAMQIQVNRIACATTELSPLEIDELLVQAEKFIGKNVKVQGLCTHVCSHGGTKLFLMGSDDSKTIRVQAGKIGSFDVKCKNSMLTIEGELKEDRIDEAYLQKWEAKLKEEKNEQHGEAKAHTGCNTEKRARNEKAKTEDGRIADFRIKIKERKQKEGKAYLSFYYIEANKHEIQ